LSVAAWFAACAKEPPATDEFTKLLDPDTLAAWLDRGEQALLFDLRPDSLYVRGRLPGAIPSQGKRVPDLLEVLPFDPAVALVFYDQASRNPPADAVAWREAAAKYRFSRVFWLRGGVEGWIARGHGTDGYRPLQLPHGRAPGSPP
jgi:rhodanese-related sulfurtransferase